MECGARFAKDYAYKILKYIPSGTSCITIGLRHQNVRRCPSPKYAPGHQQSACCLDCDYTVAWKILSCVTAMFHKGLESVSPLVTFWSAGSPSHNIHAQWYDIHRLSDFYNCFFSEVTIPKHNSCKMHCWFHGIFIKLIAVVITLFPRVITSNNIYFTTPKTVINYTVRDQQGSSVGHRAGGLLFNF